VAGKVAVLVANDVDVGIGVKVPGCRILSGVAEGVGDRTDGNVGGMSSEFSSGANMKATNPNP